MLILGSSSPRRFKILSQITNKFKVVVSSFEEIMAPDLSPELIVQDLALGKGREVLGRHIDDVIICGDTIVYSHNKAMGKPRSESECFEMIQKVVDYGAIIYTGNGILSRNQFLVLVTSTKVSFDQLSKQQIWDYIRDPATKWGDHAGGFSLLDKAQKFATIEGELESGLGLSKSFLLENLPKFGFGA